MTTIGRSKKKGGKVDRAWLADHLNDPYVKLARKEGYRSRAAYKLEEIDRTLALIRPGHLVVDLGSAPGAWSQYLRRKMTTVKRENAGSATSVLSGRIVALDLLPMEPIEGVEFIQGDFREDEVVQRLASEFAGQRVDIVVSDMAPNLSGVASSDSARIEHLVELAIDFAREHLAREGALVAKVFHGSGYSQLVERFKRAFRTVKPVKPKASRGRSAETYLVGIGPRDGTGSRGAA